MRHSVLTLAVAMLLSVVVGGGVGAQALTVSLDGPAVLRIGSQQGSGQPLDINLSSTGDIYLAVSTDSLQFIDELNIFADQNILIFLPIESNNGDVSLGSTNGEINGGAEGVVINVGGGNGDVVIAGDIIVTNITDVGIILTPGGMGTGGGGGSVTVTSGVNGTITASPSAAPAPAVSASDPVAWPHAGSPVQEFTDENPIQVTGDVLLLIDGPLGSSAFDAGNSVFIASAGVLIPEPATGLMILLVGSVGLGLRRRTAAISSR